MMKCKISRSDDKCMAGAELKRVRERAGLTQEGLAANMHDWGWYRDKVIRFEGEGHFCLNPLEMQALLDALGATSL